MHLWLIYLRNRDRKALAASITTGVLCTFSISPGLFVWVLFALLSFREKEKKILPYLLPVSMAGLTFGIIWLIRSAYPASGDVLQSDIIKGLSYTWKGTNLVTFSFVSTWWQKSVLLAVALILLVTKRVQPRGLAIAAAIMIVPLWMTLTMRSSFTDSYVWLRYYFMPSLGLCMLAGELLQAPWREKLSMSRQSVSFVILAVLLPMIYLNARETDRVQNAGPLTSYLEINAEAVKFEQAYRDAAYRYAAYYRTSTISVPAIELPITGYPGTHTPRFILGYVLPYSDKLTVVEQAGSDFFTFFRAP